jgi:hypothetical protein
MIYTLLLSVVSTLVGLGTSPLADPGHTHDWVVVPDQAPDETALHDRNWTQTMRQDGRTLNLVLMRSDLSDDGAPVVMDVIIAADCANSRLGLKEAYFFQSPMGSKLRVPIDYIEMDLAAEPLDDDDRAILAAACN